MRDIVRTYVERFKQEKQARRRLAGIISVLAVVVALGVFWQLHETGVAMANEVFCGEEEHQHDESCYETQLVCGQEENAEGHTHSEECDDPDAILVCALEESEEGHVHDDSCYEEVLACNLEEHTHTAACLIDETADVETAEDWEATLPELTGSQAYDVAAIAQSQIGYTESASNFQLAEDGETRQGYTRYGAWYGNPYGDWDAMFASFCLYYAGVSAEDFPEAAGAYAWATSLQKIEEDMNGELALYADACEYKPKTGDLIFLDTEEDSKVDRVGIVEEAADEISQDTGDETVISIKTIEGDCDDIVSENEYQSDDTRIIGYGIMPGTMQTEERMIDAETETSEADEEDLPAPIAEPETMTDTEEDEAGIAALSADSSADFAVLWYPDYAGDKKHYGQIYVNLFDAETNEKITGRTTTLSYDNKMHSSIELAVGSDFIGEMGVDGSTYLFSYATVTPHDDEPAGSRDNPVQSVKLTYEEANTYTWTYTFYDANEVLLYSFTETGRHGVDNGDLEPELNLYFTKNPYVITWSTDENSNADRSYVSFETRDADTEELLGGSGSWDKTNITTAIAMASNGLLNRVHLGADYTYSHAVVYDPETNKSYGSNQNPVTAIWAEVEQDKDNGGSEWTYRILSGDQELAVVTKFYPAASEGSANSSYDLLIKLYYSNAITNQLCVALDSRSGGAGYGGRDYIKGIQQYADASGNITITLPDNAHLGENFVVYEDKESGKKVTVNASKVTGGNNFVWKVVGWFNIATGQYVDVSNGPAATTVNLQDGSLNVFYADLIAANYNNGSEDDAQNVKSELIGDFVKVKLFDYNELFNLYSSALTQTSIESESWNAGYDNPYGARLYKVPILSNIRNLYDQGEFITKSFLFTDDGWTTGNLVYPSNLNYWNEWTGHSDAHDSEGNSIRHQLIPASNWDISSTDSALLRMLFNESGSTYGVHYIGEADGLFQYGGPGDVLEITDPENPANDLKYDFNGYYYYSSALNAAAYNQNDSRMYLYDEPEKYNGYTMFLPFNSFHNNAYGGREIDYWFGMKMEVNFYLPGKTGEIISDTNENNYVNQVNGKEMIFNFTGDDDIMVFVDDQLVLDMAGIHDEAVGWINFATGQYYYHCLDQVDHTAGGAEITGNLPLDSGTHKLSVYYLERGAGASNLTVSFNVIPKWRYYSDKTTTVTATKEWADGKEYHESDSVKMGLFESLLEGEYFVETDADGNISCKVTTDQGNQTYKFEKDSPYAYDGDDQIIALHENDSFYILVDQTSSGIDGTQELNQDNDWMYEWELLESDRTYQVLELSGLDGYTTKSSSASFDTWKYWHIIGEDQLEEMVSDQENKHWILLTDAAAGADSSTSHPKGNVLKNSFSDVTDTAFSEVTFSEALDWTVSTDTMVAARFGEISNIEIEGLTNEKGERIGVRWEVIFTGKRSEEDEYTNPEKAHTFYLRTEDGSAYLGVSQTGDQIGALILTDSKEKAAAFYMDAFGELRVENLKERVVIQDGVLQVIPNSDVVEKGTDNINIRIYTLSDVDTYGTAFHIVNTPQLILKKVNGDTEESLIGAEFTLQNLEGKYYFYHTDTDETEWVDEKTVIVVDDYDGFVLKLPDGSYTLIEVKSPDGYVLLSESITFLVKNGVFTANTQGDNNWRISDNSLILTVDNLPSSTLPNTGGSGTLPYTLAGLLLIFGASFLMYRSRRRRKECVH